jgi:hypothetical protein
VSKVKLFTLMAAVLTLSALPYAQAQDSAPGVREFTQSDTWRVPAGVVRVTVELWGGGGGGAAAWSAPVSADPGGGGGGGGAGAYVRTAVTVTPGETLTVRLGEGGAGGGADARDAAKDGGNGADTSLLRGDIVLAVARGGRGGALPKRGAIDGGLGGRGGVAEPTDHSLSRSGSDGLPGFRGGLPESLSTPGGAGGQAISGTLRPTGSFGGDGARAMTFGYSEAGKPGGRGHVVIAW